ncbi:heterokaryon incompatibility protein-domain-containing protein [Xylaria arbuscula]|nr:heterokaryon incompatibility protein-domain-containing protein [Xylaria arbuscula]
MWLINTETCALENITNPQMGSYAILSHTWEEEEVSFQQYHNIHEARKLKGLEKINMTIQLARNRGLQYAWVDTCCIDKSSSAELSEAINSMFKWYSDAAVCLVFLSDLSSNKVLLSTPDSNPRTAALARMGQLDGHQMSHNDLLARCRWFYRGWTLQELIAPTDVEFYDDGWNLIGNKWTLTVTITSITHIPFEVLSIPTLLRKVPIAQRMSWAANRSTTRVEDIAYCLFGLFGINLAPLYGEGENAFLRLQEELLRQSDDMSLFAWKAEAEHSQPYRGILAYSPREFRDSSFIGRFQRSVIFRRIARSDILNNGAAKSPSEPVHLFSVSIGECRLARALSWPR